MIKAPSELISLFSAIMNCLFSEDSSSEEVGSKALYLLNFPLFTIKRD
jgi:hypothetical protein